MNKPLQILFGIAGFTFLIANFSLAKALPHGQTFRWKAADGTPLSGLYYPGESGKLTWFLLHGLGSAKEEWNPLVEQLLKLGVGVVIYDARGHGTNNKGNHGQPLNYQPFSNEEWQKMPDDLSRSIDAFRRQYHRPLESIAVGGASLGANVAFVYAAEHADVPAALLLSPGENYAGIAIAKAFDRYGQRPLFCSASPSDTYAYDTVRAMALKRNDPRYRFAIGEGALHGVQMFSVKGYLPQLVTWMTSLSPTKK